MKALGLGVLLLLVACNRHPSSAPSRARDGGTVAMPADARSDVDASRVETSADANVNTNADANVDDKSAESPLHDIFNQKASAPLNDGPPGRNEIPEPDPDAFGFGRIRRPSGTPYPQQGAMGHGAAYRRDAGATD